MGGRARARPAGRRRIGVAIRGAAGCGGCARQVDLGQAVGPELLGDVDQQAELDAVAAGEAELLEDPAERRRLAGQGLAHPGQFGKEELEHGTRHQFGDPPAPGGVAVQRPGVEALDEGDMFGGEQRAQQPGDEGGGRVGHVGVQVDDDVAAGGGERRRHGLALAAGPARPGHHHGPGVAGLLGGVVQRAVVEHDDLVDQPVPPARGQERLHDRPNDRAHGRALVTGRDADRDGPAGPGLGPEHGCAREITVVIGVGHAHDSSSRAALSGPARAGYHGSHHPERLRDGPVDVAATCALRDTVGHLVPMPDR